MYLWEITFWTFPLLNHCCVDLRVLWWGWGMEVWLDWDFIDHARRAAHAWAVSWPKFKHLCIAPVRYLTQTSCLGLPTSKLEWLLRARYFTWLWVGPLCCSVDSVCCVCCYKLSLQTNHGWFALNSYESQMMWGIIPTWFLILRTEDSRDVNFLNKIKHSHSLYSQSLVRNEGLPSSDFLFIGSSVTTKLIFLTTYSSGTIATYDVSKPFCGVLLFERVKRLWKSLVTKNQNVSVFLALLNTDWICRIQEPYEKSCEPELGSV